LASEYPIEAGCAMTALWKFIGIKRYREIVGWISGGVAVAIAGLWTALVFLFPPQKGSEAKGANVEASCGSVAIGGNVTGAVVSSGAVNASDCSTKTR